MAPESQTKLQKFRDFSSNFAKNTELQLQFSQRRNKIFDFSGRFSESSNNCFLPGCNHFSPISLLEGVKLLQKQQGSLKLE
jgi:hypothetical protein